MTDDGVKRTNRATTFTRREIDAVCQAARALARGGDASIIARAEPFRSAMAKFGRMQASLDEQDSLAVNAPRGSA